MGVILSCRCKKWVILSPPKNPRAPKLHCFLKHVHPRIDVLKHFHVQGFLEFGPLLCGFIKLKKLYGNLILLVPILGLISSSLSFRPETVKVFEFLQNMISSHELSQNFHGLEGSQYSLHLGEIN